ncbi:T9SS type A sorting domain-containing protein [candidate division KSB1 bacterium]
MVRLSLYLLSVLVFCGQSTFASDGWGYSFPSLFTHSDLIVKGTVSGYNYETELITVSIEETHWGTAGSATITCDISDLEHLYLNIDLNETFLFFLKEDDSICSVNYAFSTVDQSIQSDLLALLEQYRLNPDLFGPEGKTTLLELFFTLHHQEIKLRLLDGMISNFTEDDLPFFQTLLEESYERYQAFAIDQIGYLYITSMRTEIEDLLQYSSSVLIMSSCIKALGYIGNKESYFLIEPYLFQGSSLTSTAIVAAGNLGYVEALEPLKQIYTRYPSWSTKMSIVTAVSRIHDSKKALETLRYFLTVYEHESLTEYIKEKIIMLEGVFVLEQNFPNPFNTETTISYKLPRRTQVLITVYDITGRQVAQVVNDNIRQGHHTAHWDATGLPSGVYICRLCAEGISVIRKLTLLK